MASVHVFLVGSRFVEQYQMEARSKYSCCGINSSAVHIYCGVCGSVDSVDLVYNVESITADTITCTCMYIYMYMYIHVHVHLPLCVADMTYTLSGICGCTHNVHSA